MFPFSSSSSFQNEIFTYKMKIFSDALLKSHFSLFSAKETLLAVWVGPPWPTGVASNKSWRKV